MVSRYPMPSTLRALYVVAFLGSGICTACTFARAAWYNTPTLEAPGNFDSREVRPTTMAVPLPVAPVEAALAVPANLRDRYGTFDQLLSANDTRAFLVVRDDIVVYERYFGGVTCDTLLPSFSISKTFAALLVGCAVDDGLIASIQLPVTTFLPELSARENYDQLRLEHLLRMVSGIDFEEESYDSATLYYCAELHEPTLAFSITRTPGTFYRYGSVNIQMLWEVLHRSLRGRTVAQYFEERVWRQLGTEHAATWSIDSQESGIEKLFGGFNATARDFAKLGLLFLHEGTWRGTRVISPGWVAASLRADPVAGIQQTTDGRVRRGMYQWFLTLDGEAYFAKGYLGQYVWVDPARRTVIVRFGENHGSVDWLALMRDIAGA